MEIILIFEAVNINQATKVIYQRMQNFILNNLRYSAHLLVKLVPRYEGFPDTLYFDEITAAIFKDDRQKGI